MRNQRAISTLQDAAQWLTMRTGEEWDSRRVLEFTLKIMLDSVLQDQERDAFLWVVPPAGTQYGFRRFDVDTASVKVSRLDPLDINPELTEYEAVMRLAAGGSVPLPVGCTGEPWQGKDGIVIYANEVPFISADAVRIWAPDLVRLAKRFEVERTDRAQAQAQLARVRAKIEARVQARARPPVLLDTTPAEASEQADTNPQATLPEPASELPAAPVVAASAPGGVEPAAGKKWTPERLAELKAYREKHGTEQAAKQYGISAARVRALLPGDKPQPKGYSAFTHRQK